MGTLPNSPCHATWVFHKCPEGWKIIVFDDTKGAICGKRRKARSAVIFGRTQAIAEKRARAYMKAIVQNGETGEGPC